MILRAKKVKKHLKNDQCDDIIDCIVCYHVNIGFIRRKECGY